jgi:hypothetical protein
VCTSHTLNADFLYQSSVRIPHAMKKTRKVQQRNLIGQRVRQARLKSKPVVSQDDLAGRLAGQGIVLDRSAISRIESQSRYVMDYEAAAVARALKISVAWLFGDES